MIPLLFSDPVGDDYGLGYAYPRAALFAEAGFADLTGFEALRKGEKVVLRVRLHRYPNPGNALTAFRWLASASTSIPSPAARKNSRGPASKPPQGRGGTLPIC